MQWYCPYGHSSYGCGDITENKSDFRYARTYAAQVNPAILFSYLRKYAVHSHRLIFIRPAQGPGTFTQTKLARTRASSELTSEGAPTACHRCNAHRCNALFEIPKIAAALYLQITDLFSSL